MIQHYDKLGLLRRTIAEVEPMYDQEVTWLIRHRPSVAFACCIGAGPWKIGRRRNVQQSFREAIGDGDLSDRSTLTRLVAKCQLQWQITWFCHVYRTTNQAKTKFDDAFAPKLTRKIHAENFKKLITPDESYPKVIGLFKRDYLFQPCFPVDRHVRRFMEDHGLPHKAVEVEKMFAAIGENPSFYSRAIFGSKTSNPILAPTRTIW